MLAAELGTRYLRAQRARARRGAPCEGEPRAALVELRASFNELHALGIPYEAARTRLLIAEACHAHGDHDAADMESRSARLTLESLAKLERTLAAERDPVAPAGSRRANLKCSCCSRKAGPIA